MIIKSIIIANKYGIHTRAAAKLVEVARQYTCKIELVNSKGRADCKSIMALITLGARKGANFELEVDGDDEKKAAKAVKELIEGHFGEEE